MKSSSNVLMIVKVIPAILFVSMMGVATFTLADEAKPRPNIVIIISDDQAWGDYSFMGHPHIQTPRIDKLAEQSLTFTRGYVPNSLCRPSLATIATGLYPHQHSITGNDPRRKNGERIKIQERRDPNFQHADRFEKLIANIEKHPTLPRLLGEVGYVSHQSGKWWEGHYSRGGFTHGMTHGDRKRGGRHGDEGLKIGREGMKPVFDFIDDAVKQDKPFFIWYAPFLPHTPHNPPPRLLDKYRNKTDSLPMAKYWAMCEWFDETCGELLDYLDEKKLADDTIVIYVTDNGWINQRNASRYAPRSKRSPYEGGVRTPIMIRWPGKVKPKRDEQTPVLSIDIAPTILAACGLDATDAMQGVDLLDAEAVGEREMIFGEVFAHDVFDLDDPTSNLTYRWCIEDSWKLIVPHAENTPDGKVELFDVMKDPHEKENVADEHPAVVAKLREAIDGWWRRTP